MIIRKARSSTTFAEAVHEICKAMQCFQAGDPQANAPGFSRAQRDMLGRWMAGITDAGGEMRHKRWFGLIRQGEIGFPSVKLEYKAKGSWRYEALGATRKNLENDIYPYSPIFLSCDWKWFHDALLAHRFAVIHDILPK